MKASLSISTCFSILAALAIVVASCGGDSTPPTPEAKGCSINSECDNPLVCAFKRCHDQCTSSRDCAIGLRCVQAKDVDTGASLGGTVCQLPDEATNKCSINSECPGTQICGIDAKCRDQCALDKDCLKDQVCTDSTCADKVELNDKGGLDMVIDMVVTRDSGPSGDDGGWTTTTTTTGMGGGTGSGGADAGNDVSMGGSGGTDAGTDSTTADVSKDMGIVGPCGHNGEQCCANSMCNLGATCNGSQMCVTCGGKNQPCCGNLCTDTNLDCVANTCQCGAANQVCCGGTMCSGGLTCAMPDAGRSSCACGGNGQACCPNMTCNGSSLKCAGLKCSCITACNGDRYSSSNAYLTRTDGSLWYYTAYYTMAMPVNDASAVLVKDFKKVASSGSFACGIKADKSVWCWAHPNNNTATNSYGQLGDGTQNFSKAPVQVITTTLGGPPLTNAIDISNFGDTTCAVTDNGTADGADDSVWCWGAGAQGQLGNGTSSTFSAVAVQVVLSLGGSALANIDQISLGYLFACAHQRVAGAEGSAWCWGYNNYGQLAVDPQTPLPQSNVPRQIGALLTGVSQVAAANYLACARTNNDVWCWGYGSNVGLGNGTTSANKPNFAPVQVLASDGGAAFTGVADLKTSSAGPCVLKSGDNSVWCWYSNSQTFPTPASPAGFALSSVAYWDYYGSSYLCFARTDGDIYFHNQKAQYPPSCPP